MAAKFVILDRDTPMMLPPDLRDWISEDSMVHFIVDAVEALEIKGFGINERGSGSAQYPPQMMLSLLIYCYATKRFSSREIERATYTDIAVRYICGGDLHPDHDTICAFRLKNREAFKEVFTKVLLLGVELGHLKKIGGISIDGTKIKANASKHAAVSYKRAGEMIAQLEQEIEELVRKAEDADSAPLDDGLVLPDEIKRREDRKAALERACRTMEERYEETRREKEREYAAKKAKRETESRIMKAGNGKHYEQAYNAQAAVDTEGSMLIVGQYVTAHANDKQELPVAAASVDPAIREVDTVCADTGYFCEKAVLEVEDDDGPMVYCAVEKQSHHRTVEDLLKKAEPVPPPDDAPVKEKMAFRLKTQAGRTVYKKRKETVEPVFGIIKTILGFRGFLLRGLDKVSIEWDLITAAYNFKRLHKLCGGNLLEFTKILPQRS